MKTSAMSVLSTTGVLALSLCLSASAEGEKKPNDPVGTEVSAEPSRQAIAGMESRFTPRLEREDKLIGATIQTPSGEDLGKVQDLILNRHRSRICYAITDFKKVTGSDDQLHAVPWPAFKFKSDGGVLLLNIDKGKLTTAPGFPKGRYPDFDSERWSQEVNRFYGQEERMRQEARYEEQMLERMGRSAAEKEPVAEDPTGEADAGKLWGRKVDSLIGLKVRNLESKDLGKIKHILVDLHRGHLAYALVAFGGLIGIGEKEAPVPWTSVELSPTEENARVNADREMLEAIAFKEGESPANLSDRAYAERIYQQFHREPYWEVYGYVGPQRTGRTMMPHFDPASMRTMAGTVESVGTYQPPDAAFEGQTLRLRTEDGRNTTVYAGPRRFAEDAGLRFNRGDRVMVIGSYSMIGDQAAVIATEIRKSDQRLVLRDAQGRALWSAPRDQPERHKPEGS